MHIGGSAGQKHAPDRRLAGACADSVPKSMAKNGHMARKVIVTPDDNFEYVKDDKCAIRHLEFAGGRWSFGHDRFDFPIV